MCSNIDSIIEMHDTWLVIDAIQGCTNGCKYCLLQATGDNQAKPKIKVPAAQAISCLFSSKYYDPEMPISLLPGTDAFLNKTNIDYTKELLELLEKKHVKNPIILVTKCLIPDYFADYLQKLNDEGMTIVVYLSLSGLSKEYEPNINHANVKLNFYNLASRGIRVIHYYRPFIPDNSSAKSIDKVLDFVNKYTNISVITGLKLKSDFIDKISFCKVTTTKRNECLQASSVWPRQAYNYFYKNYQHPQNVFQTNYCALAQVLEKPCPQFYGTLECRNYNHCSLEQRKRCAKYKKNQPRNINEKLVELLKKIEKYDPEMEVIKEDNNIILKNIELSVSDVAYLTFMLGIKVSVFKKMENDKRFSSSLSNGKPLIYDNEGYYE